MDIKWVFLNSDGSKEEATINEPKQPSPGEGKNHGVKGYVVRYVIDGRTTSPESIAIATEYDDYGKSNT